MPSRPAEPPSTLSTRARTVRLAFALAGVVLLLTGTLRWDDADFPFGPFRMFSTSTPPDGNVHSMALDARMPDGSWRRVPLESGNVGINRAEAEGQADRFKADPALLQRLAVAHDRLHPRQRHWTGVRLVRQYLMLRHRTYVGTREFVIAEWSRP